MPNLKVGLLFKFRNVSYLLGYPVLVYCFMFVKLTVLYLVIIHVGHLMFVFIEHGQN